MKSMLKKIIKTLAMLCFAFTIISSINSTSLIPSDKPSDTKQEITYSTNDEADEEINNVTNGH